ncbi:MAG: o-succinylbenzoate synthase [Pegethrix bostrychoides GSE-TBD4-15B]|jgi:O-succinylbenzoate synthase|uniref:o-succinylbenzoate synthase n=1 Tax=Pegethrix bostrychoides GSE-TBD4-15B TaxID=2839662 RepID=A0A951U5I0_9CYAN|nr:o-succinylbenzoate synthase [Pegethrix bostrychoides GSE-TBD4-15B]
MKLEVRAYARPFKTPLQTYHGDWSVRRGLILRMDTESGIGWGEVAPIAAFGTERYEAALEFCQSLPQQITLAELQQIPATHPACRFGLEAAWELAQSSQAAPYPSGRLRLETGGTQSEQLEVSLLKVGGSLASTLLPTGSAALDSPLLFGNRLVTARPHTFKWKIGAAPIQQELDIFHELISLLPMGAKLRLDANGGLTWQEACTWLQLCDGYGIEFLEQPLPPEQFSLMLKLRQRYSTPIALDESVTGLAQLKDCLAQGWRGIFVIKAPLMGSPVTLREFCQAEALDLVWSSVFETTVARQYIEEFLIAALPVANRAVGFGVDQWFADGWERLSPEQIWERLA